VDIFSVEDRHTSGLYAKHQLAIVSGQGATLWDANGREYIDCMGAHGVANLGHAHTEVIRAIAEQASRLISLPETFYNDQRAALTPVWEISQPTAGHGVFHRRRQNCFPGLARLPLLLDSAIVLRSGPSRPSTSLRAVSLSNGARQCSDTAGPLHKWPTR